MNYDIEYDITVYDKYTSKIKELLKEDKFKIYIISDSKQQKNKELIYYIREDLDDWQSIIIIMKKETDDYQRLANKSLFLLDIIPKEKDFREQLKRAIQIALKNYDQRPNTLKYCYKKVYYNIEFWKIIYIEKQPEMKICKIKTIDKDYYIQGSLNQKQELLDKRFLKCNRSYIINLEQIESYNPKTNRITFKNKETLDATSRTKKKEMIQYFRRIEK
jgi:DNA-binding LytR/AlgR family response regulator